MMMNHYKISQHFKFLLFVFLTVGSFMGCKPKVDEPAISNCLLTKVETLGVNDQFIDSQQKKEFNTSSRITFEYDERNRPIKFLYYDKTGLYKFEKLIYDASGKISSGQITDNKTKKQSVVQYGYKTNKLDFRNENDNVGFPVKYENFLYDSTGRLYKKTRINLNYTDSTHNNYFFTAYIFSYLYDKSDNLIARFSKYAKSSINTTDYYQFALSLTNAKEYKNISLSNYDNKFNPYHSDSIISILFDEFPSINNAKNLSYFYVNSGVKYADVIYNYQYNVKGFPFLYTSTTSYSDDYKKSYNVIDGEIFTSSIEYNCK